MKLIHDNIIKLREIKSLLSKLPNTLYTTPEPILNGATIGQHFRHVLEFYLCMIKGSTSGEICYDNRERNVLIETNIDYASDIIDEIISFLNSVNTDKPIVLKANYSSEPDDLAALNSSLYRELAYGLDHTVHHLAIIKIALDKENIEVDENFGVAPSTIRYKQSLQ